MVEDECARRLSCFPGPTVIVACATDRRFTQLAGVMLASLLDRGEADGWRIIVFGYRLRAGDKAKLRQSCGAGAERLEFFDIDPGAAELQGLLPSNFSANPSIFVRMLIPALLSDESGRLLYLDSDTLIAGSLKPLAEVDLGGLAVAAVEDETCHPKHDGRLPLAPDRPYFNSGVLLIDLAAWRRDDLSRRILEFAKANATKIAFPDQDALNCVLDGRAVRLDPRWNLTRPKAEQGCDDPRIMHFTGTKPWSAACRHPARALFLEYRAQTPWRNARLMSRLETRLARSALKRWVGLKRRWARPA